MEVEENSKCQEFSHSLYENSSHKANVKNSAMDLESFSSLWESCEGKERSSTSNISGRKQVRIRRVFPAHNQCTSCRSTEMLRNGVLKKLDYHERTGKFEKQVVKLTRIKPFELKTQERGQLKEQEFVKKLHEMLAQEEKWHIPIAQGLPLTTDEPQILSKPPPRGKTRPLYVKLHTETRAIQRAQFDQMIAEKNYFLEQQRLEKERMQKVLEMEEVKRMRQEMIPQAQMMPLFDHPFVPKRSTVPLTIPKEPIFHTLLRKRPNWGLCM